MLVINSNRPYYSESLLSLVQPELLDQELTNDNLEKLADAFDQKRFREVDNFADMLDCSNYKESNIKKEKVYDALNSKLNSLPSALEEKKKKIKFLFNIAATLSHW